MQRQQLEEVDRVDSFESDLTIDLLDSTVVVQGGLDAATSPLLAASIAEGLSSYPFALTIDLARLDFIDASGLSVLKGGKRRSEAQGCRFVLRDPPPLLTRLLGIIGMEEAFVIEHLESASQWTAVRSTVAEELQV